MMATTVAIHVAKSAIDALVMDRLHHPPPQVQREFLGEHEGSRFRLRWTRPALTFPDDVPDTVRIGLAFEGGVQLASGRILSCDMFVTATAAPRITNDENGWFIRLTPDHIEPGEIHLTYAGAPLGTMRARLGSDLPDEAALAGLREALATAIIHFYEEFPDIPLTYGFPTHSIAPEAAAIHVYSETHGRALIIALTLPDDVIESGGEDMASMPPQFFVTPLENIALTISADAFSAAFARGWAARSTLHEDIAELAATLDGEIILFTGEAATETGQHESFTLQAHPEITEDGALILTYIESEVVTKDDTIAALHPSLAKLTEQALQDILTPALGKPGGALTWFWHVVRGATPGMLRFAPQRVQIAAGMLSLVGELPVEPATSDLPDDGPNCDLRVVRGSDDPLDDDTPAFSVRVTHQQGVVAPCDYAWQWSLSPAPAEHGPLLKVPAAMVESEPDSTLTPHTRLLPRGVVAITATLIDAFGRVAQAAVEIDMSAGDDAPVPAGIVAISETPTIAPRALTHAGVAVPARPVVPATNYATAYRATAQRMTVSQPVAKHPRRAWNVIATVLAIFALIFTAGAFLLAHAATSGTENVVIPPPVTPTTTTASSTVLPQVTAGATPSPTATPELFGRFDTTTTAMQFTCSGGSAGAETLALSNNGTGPLDWTAHVIGTLQDGTTPWAVVSPASGTLAPGAVNAATVTVTPNSGFCSMPAGTTFQIQFTAPAAVPLTIAATQATGTPATTPTP
jgi:hypothetical protein